MQVIATSYKFNPSRVRFEPAGALTILIETIF